MNEKRIKRSFIIVFAGIVILLGLFFLSFYEKKDTSYKNTVIGDIVLSKPSSSTKISGIRDNNNPGNIEYYNFYIKNTSDEETQYSLYLDGDNFDKRYISYRLLVNDEKTDYLKANDEGLIYTSVIGPKETTTFKLGLWLEKKKKNEIDTYKGKKLAFNINLKIN